MYKHLKELTVSNTNAPFIFPDNSSPRCKPRNTTTSSAYTQDHMTCATPDTPPISRASTRRCRPRLWAIITSLSCDSTRMTRRRESVRGGLRSPMVLVSVASMFREWGLDGNIYLPVNLIKCISSVDIEHRTGLKIGNATNIFVNVHI